MRKRQLSLRLFLVCALVLMHPLTAANMAAEASSKQSVNTSPNADAEDPSTLWLREKTVHLFAGAGISRFSQSGYAGVLAARKGRLHKSGFRLRFEASGGLFQYQADFFNGFQTRDTTILGAFAGAQAHIGYVVIKQRFGGGVYLGADVRQIDTSPNDPVNDDIGTKLSPAVRFEGYAKPFDQLLLSVQASLKRDFGTGFVRGALSIPIAFGMSFGPEVQAIFADEFLEMRYGAELLMPLRKHRKMAVSGGYAVDSDNRSGGYGGIHFKWDY